MPSAMRRKSSDAGASRQVPHRPPEPVHVILKRAHADFAPRTQQPANTAVGRSVDAGRIVISSNPARQIPQRPSDRRAAGLGSWRGAPALGYSGSGCNLPKPTDVQWSGAAARSNDVMISRPG